MIFSIKRINKTYLLLFLILALAAFLRFWRLPEMANYDFDQEYAANFAYTVVKDFPIQLIGQGLSIQGLFMGPLYFYFLVPFFAAFNLHPIGGYVGSIILSLVIISLYFLVAKELFGNVAAIIAAFLRSILFIEINNDWNMAPVYASELLVLLTWLGFYRYWQEQIKVLPFLALLFGLYTSIHPILFPFYLVFLALLLIKKRLPNIKTTILSIIFFIIPISPLLLFEYWHKFLEVKLILGFFIGKSAEPINFNRFTSYLNTISAEPSRILALNFLAKELVLLVLFGLVSFLIYKKVSFFKNRFHYQTLLLTFLTFVGYYTLFPAHVPEYYFLALSSLTLLYLSALLSLLKKHPIFTILLI